MEMEFFVNPGEDESWHDYWIKERLDWYVRHGVRAENLRLRPHDADELSHYSKATTDVEYLFPWGWAELEGIANRTDFDLRQHSAHSGARLTYFDNDTNQHVTPYVIEPASGVDRAALAFMVDAYDEEEVGGEAAGAGAGEARVVLRFHPRIAPVQAAVLPLSRNARLTPLAREVFAGLVDDGRWRVETTPRAYATAASTRWAPPSALPSTSHRPTLPPLRRGGRPPLHYRRLRVAGRQPGHHP